MSGFRSRDLRKGRRSEPGRAYLITITTWRRRCLFADLFRGRFFVNTLRHLHENEYGETQFFVVMPNHVHWLFILGQRLSLSRTVDVFKT